MREPGVKIFFERLDKDAENLPEREVSDVYEKFFATAQLATGIGGADGYERAVQLTSEIAGIDNAFAKMPGHAPTPTERSESSNRLEKRARGTRTDKTFYPKSGITVVAELDENNHVIRTYVEGEQP